MSYIICNNCSGYYELQEGESPENFDLECECGGNLISVDVNNGNKQNFSNIKGDYEELLRYLKNNKLNFNYKESEIPISFDNGEKVLLNFENIKLTNSTISNINDTPETNRGYLTLTNKKIVFSGINKLEYVLGDIKSIKSFYNGFGLVLNNEFEIKDYFIGIDKMRIGLPLKGRRDKYSVYFNGEMIKIMIENAIKSYKDALKSENIKSKDIYNKKATKQKSSAKNEKKKSEKLMNCQDCGHKISRKAKKCPNCGRPITYKDLPEEDTKMTFKSFMGISFIIFCSFSIVGLFLIPIFTLVLYLIWFIITIAMFISYLKDRKK